MFNFSLICRRFIIGLHKLSRYLFVEKTPTIFAYAILLAVSCGGFNLANHIIRSVHTEFHAVGCLQEERKNHSPILVGERHHESCVYLDCGD